MWLNKKKDKPESKIEENVVPIVPVQHAHAPPVPPKREDKKTSIKKKILQLSGLTHHHQPTDGKLSHSEMKKLEETKNRLFRQGSHSTNPSESPANGHGSQRHDDSEGRLNVHAAMAEVSVAPESSFYHPKDFNVPGLRLPALAAVQIKAREVVLHRNVAGDFGFNIRRVQYPLAESAEMSSVVFAEPAQQLKGPPRANDLLNGLLPGDQLLEVEGHKVENLKRDELLSLIQEAGQSIRLRVQVVPELAELCGRSSANTEAHLQLNNLIPSSASQLDNVPEDEKFWLIHSNGYTMVRLLEQLPDGRARILVNDQEMVVDNSDIDKANPQSFDRSNDIAALKNLNETSAIHLLRNRYGSNLQYTNIGPRNLIYVASKDAEFKSANPFLIDMFKSCRRSQMPAHIYSAAQQTYRALQMSSNSQSVVFTGVSGSGKSLQTRHFVEFLCGCAGRSKMVTYEDISMAIGVLEAFGNCSMQLNRNASRFVQLLTLGFDSRSALTSAKFQTFFLDMAKLTVISELNSTFHIFYYLWQGVDEKLAVELGLSMIDRPFFNELSAEDDKEMARQGWKRVLDVFAHFDFTQKQIRGVVSVLAAIMHLLYSGAQGNVATRSSFTRTANAQKAAELLGLGYDQLNVAVFRGQQGTELNSRLTMSSRTGLEALTSFAQCLYNELFSALTNLLNNRLHKNPGILSINLLDVPGSNFNSLWTQNPPAKDLSDFVYNYMNERLSELFYKTHFEKPADLYNIEQVDVQVPQPRSSPHHVTRLIDRKQQLLNTADVDRRSEEPRGIMYILEEESVFPGANEGSFIERVFMHCEDSKFLRRTQKSRLQFVLGHSFNESPVHYSVEGWLKRAQPSHATSTVPATLQNSDRVEILDLFTISATPSRSSDSAFKLRRATQSMNDVVTSAGCRGAFGGFFTATASQLDYIFSLIERGGRIQFVHCIQPYSFGNATPPRDVMDISVVRQQMRSYLLIDAVRAANRGYPERLPFRDFRRRFQCLVRMSMTASTINDALDDREAVKTILERTQISEHRYRLGISQVLIRSDVMAELEDKRDLCLSGLIEGFQDQCRKFLATKWLEKRRIQEHAVKCIQRNINQFLQLRNWPWWKLYNHVLPLLGVVRADENERQWREKVAKLEQYNAELRTSRTRADEQLKDIEQLLKTECQTTRSLTTSLEQESEIRLRLEAELRAMKQKLQQKENDDEKSRAKLDMNEPVVEDWIKKTPVDPNMLQELEQLREADTAHRMTLQKMSENLNDFRFEIQELRARNEELEKKGQQFDETVDVYKCKVTELEKEKLKLDQGVRDANMTISRKMEEISVMREEAEDLRTQLKNLRRNAEQSGDGGKLANTTLTDAYHKATTQNKELEEDLIAAESRIEELQQEVTRLSLNLERARVDSAKDIEAREQELDEVRQKYQRRMRTYDDQVNELNDANTILNRQLRNLEQRNRQFETQSQCGSESSTDNYRREYRKTLALLKDAQAVIAAERQKNDKSALIRKLRQQLEEAEEAKASAVRSRLSLEAEISDLSIEIENIRASKKAADDRIRDLLREKAASLDKCKDLEEQLDSVLRDYRKSVGQTEADSIVFSKQVEMIAEFQQKNQELTDKLAQADSQVSYYKNHYVEAHKLQILEHSIVEMKNRADYDRAERIKNESIITRLQDEVDALEAQVNELQRANNRQQEISQRHQRELTNEQELVRQLKNREDELQLKLKKTRDELDTVREQHAATESNLTFVERQAESFRAVLRAGTNLDEEDEDDTLELDDLEECASNTTPQEAFPAQPSLSPAVIVTCKSESTCSTSPVDSANHSASTDV